MAGSHGKVLKGSNAGALLKNEPAPLDIQDDKGLTSGYGHVYSSGNGSFGGSGKGTREIHTTIVRNLYVSYSVARSLLRI